MVVNGYGNLLLLTKRGGLAQNGKNAWESRFKTKFTGPIIPFGAEIIYKPIGKTDTAKLHKFGSKMLPGIFVGYAIQEGGYWSGDLIIVDKEDLEKADLITEVHPKRFKANEIHATKLRNGDFQFPLALDEWSQPEIKDADERDRKQQNKRNKKIKE